MTLLPLLLPLPSFCPLYMSLDLGVSDVDILFRTIKTIVGLK